MRGWLILITRVSVTSLGILRMYVGDRCLLPSGSKDRPICITTPNEFPLGSAVADIEIGRRT